MAVTTRPGTAPAEAPAPPGSSVLTRHLNLTRELATTQFKLKYTGSVLGYLWSLFKPLMFFSILYAIFVKLFKVGNASPNFALQLLLAIVLYTFFTEATQTAMASIAGTGHLIRKAYFPRQILVLASTLSAFFTFAINLCLVVVIGALLGRLQPGWRTLAVPLLLVELYALVLGVSLILSSLFVFYRDLGHIWEVFTQVLLYGSAVVYPLSLVDESRHFLAVVISMNPVTQIIEDTRHALVAGNLTFSADHCQGLWGAPGHQAQLQHCVHQIAVPWMASFVGGALYLVPLAIVAGTVVAGWLTFRRLNPRFAENL